MLQLLCPQRHCIAAVAYDPKERPFAEACGFMRNILDQAQVRQRCGICGSTKLLFEDAATGYQTLAEAHPAILQEQMKQVLTRAALEATGQTADSRERQGRDN